MVDLYESFSRGRAAGEQRRRQSTLERYFQGATQGDANALSQVYQADPTAGMQAQKFAREQQDDDMETVVRAAQVYSQTRSPQAWAFVHSKLSTRPEFAGMPADLSTPEDQEGSLKFASALVNSFGGNEQNNVQSRFINDQGEMVALMRDGSTRVVGKADPSMQILEGDGGFYGVDRRNLRAAPVQLGGAAPPPAPQGMDYGPEETDNYVRSILGRAGSLDPNLSPEQAAEVLLPHLIRQESGGNPNAVSPKGARGLTQVMPATGRDPGFGVTPLRDGSPEENVRFGRDYLIAMLRRYPGRPDLALAAYNSGPGAVDALASNAPPGAPPQQLQPKPQQISPAERERLDMERERLKLQRQEAEARRTANAVTGKAPTEGERAAFGYLQRMEAASQTLSQVEAKGYTPGSYRDYVGANNAGLSVVGPLFNRLQTPEGQQYRQAQEDWVRAKLRKESGAVIGDEEMAREIRVYFPQPGDSPLVLAQKVQARKQAEAQLRSMAGRAVPPQAAQPSAPTSDDEDDALIRKYLGR
jgi:hypothetical protein